MPASPKSFHLVAWRAVAVEHVVAQPGREDGDEAGGIGLLTPARDAEELLAGARAAVVHQHDGRARRARARDVGDEAARVAVDLEHAAVDAGRVGVSGADAGAGEQCESGRGRGERAHRGGFNRPIRIAMMPTASRDMGHGLPRLVHVGGRPGCSAEGWPVGRAATLVEVNEDGAAARRATAAPLPWDGKAERADLFLMAAITLSGLYLLALIPLTPALVGSHPVLARAAQGLDVGDDHDGRASRGSATRR